MSMSLSESQIEMRLNPWALLAAHLVLVATTATARDTVGAAPTVEVVGTTPIAGLETPVESSPANVVVISSDAIRDRPGESLADILGSRSGSAFVSSPLSNAYQPQFSYRGYTLSSLLGAPQGMSAYLDGVRINSPFGSAVDWDLIPQFALDTAAIVPGSNPLFGANTLGGALVMRTKSGDTSPGASLETFSGSFGRSATRFEAGQAFGRGFHAYVGGSMVSEDGWQDHSASDVKQLFAKVGRRTATSEIDASIVMAHSDLNGNGLVPPQLTDVRRQAVYTWPDNTRDRLEGATLHAVNFVSDEAQLATMLDGRHVRQHVSGGDVDDDDSAMPDPITGQAPGVINKNAVDQHSYGASIEWSVVKPGLRWALGANYDHAKTGFEQSVASGFFDDSRAVVNAGDDDITAALSSLTRQVGAYATAMWSPRSDVELTLSGRYDHTKLDMTDTGPTAPDLDGSHTFSAFNPSAGAVYKVTSDFTMFGNVGRGSRAPTPIELGCANPDKPCRLPNSLISDPDLKQVISKSWEVGVRGEHSGMHWSAALFGATNTDDILFVGTTTSNGYFANFGKTRRQGLEAQIESAPGMLEWSAAYGYLDATYRSPATIVSPNNSARDDDDLIEVHPGDRMTDLPRHNFKASVSLRPVPPVRLAFDLVATSNRLVRGNENNQQDGGGNAPGYALVNFRADYRVTPRWLVYAMVDNVFDTKYVTTGALSTNALDAAGRIEPDSSHWLPDTFFAPGAPRGIWLGLRYELGGST